MAIFRICTNAGSESSMPDNGFLAAIFVVLDERAGILTGKTKDNVDSLVGCSSGRSILLTARLNYLRTRVAGGGKTTGSAQRNCVWFEGTN